MTAHAGLRLLCPDVEQHVGQHGLSTQSQEGGQVLGPQGVAVGDCLKSSGGMAAGW